MPDLALYQPNHGLPQPATVSVVDAPPRGAAWQVCAGGACLTSPSLAGAIAAIRDHFDSRSHQPVPGENR